MIDLANPRDSGFDNQPPNILAFPWTAVCDLIHRVGICAVNNILSVSRFSCGDILEVNGWFLCCTGNRVSRSGVEQDKRHTNVGDVVFACSVN
jgi:hypothetical protein